MNILITGGTGFVGKKLTSTLHVKGHHVYILTRSPDTYKNSDRITYISYDQNVKKLPIIDAIINLAGDSLYGYWSKRKKRSILTSRVNVTQKIIEMMQKMDTKPRVFISASAVGFYGTSKDVIFTEKTTESGDDFLATVVLEWENTAKQAEAMGIRTVYTRFGVILGEHGALPLMSIPVKLGVGGKVSTGEQWTSWVHVDDVVELIKFCLFNEQITGPINVTSPYPQRNKDFTKVLAKVLKRPFWAPAPAVLLRLVIGEMSELITKGQYVLPKKAEANNFQFKFPHLEEALRNIKH